MTIEQEEMATGHPAKLHDGAWGAHVNSANVKPGDAVHLATKSGKAWDVVIEKVMWVGVDSDGVPCALCSLVVKTAPAKAAPAAAPAAKLADAGSAEV